VFHSFTKVRILIWHALKFIRSCSASIVVSPELDPLFPFLAMSSATNDVATLRRGILKTFEMMLKIDIERPADANSRGPFQMIEDQGLS
jgi:hypothetical protein